MKTMEDWEVWLIVGGIIGSIFVVCFFLVLCYRRIRQQSVVENILAANYSRHSVTSNASFLAAPWRTSVHLGGRGSMTPVTSMYGAAQMAPMITDISEGTKARGSARSSRNTMSLEIIQEYEEREVELGLGKNNPSTKIVPEDSISNKP